MEPEIAARLGGAGEVTDGLRGALGVGEEIETPPRVPGVAGNDLQGA
jgi:hypothetical protein